MNSSPIYNLCFLHQSFLHQSNHFLPLMLFLPKIAIFPTPIIVLFHRQWFRGDDGDGGATGAESRDCYLIMYADKKPDKVDPNEQRLSKWLNCGLSNEPLREPCVVDKLGNIFNKEALVEAFLGKKLPKEFGHIKGLSAKTSKEVKSSSCLAVQEAVG